MSEEGHVSLVQAIFDSLEEERFLEILRKLPKETKERLYDKFFGEEAI